MKTAKILGPSSAELLLRLSGEGKNIFSIADACTITGQSYKVVCGNIPHYHYRTIERRSATHSYLFHPLGRNK